MGRITAAGQITEYPLPDRSARPHAIIADPSDGGCWFTEWAANCIGRITPAGRFASVIAQVLLLGGAKSPAAITTRALQALHEVIPGSELELLAGLRHTAPENKAPGVVAETLSRFLRSSGSAT